MTPFLTCISPISQSPNTSSCTVSCEESAKNIDRNVNSNVNSNPEKVGDPLSSSAMQKKSSLPLSTSSISTTTPESTNPNTPEQSQSQLRDVPSMDIDYSIIDANDPELRLSWLSTFPLFGFAPRQPNDPRYRALAKLRLIAEQHGLEDITLTDYLLAGRVHMALLYRMTKKKLKNKKISFKQKFGRSSNTDMVEANQVIYQSTESVAYTQNKVEIGNDNKHSYHSVQKRPRSTLRRASSLPSTLQKHTPEFMDEDFCGTINNLASVSEHINYDDECNVTASIQDREASSLPSYAFNKRSHSEGGVDDMKAFMDEPSSEFQGSNVTLGKQPVIKPQQIQLLHQLMRHSESVYGLPLNAASAPSIALTSLSAKRIVCQRTGLAPKDIIYERFSAEPFHPAFYVALDHSIRAVVLCVRGTANLLDSLTDFAATQEPFAVRSTSNDGPAIIRGYGHAGVLRSARNVFREARSALYDIVSEYPEYELVLTGHSLGAATASVLSLIIRDSSFGREPMAVCFAPPPCMTLDLAEETSSSTITIVNGPDIVPRLSVALLLPYFATSKYVRDLPQGKRALLSMGLRSGLIDWKELEEHNANAIMQMKKQHDNCRLYIPGRVLQMVSKDEVNQKDISPKKLFKKRQIELVAVEKNHFLKITGKEKGMFYSHATFKYKEKLALALKTSGAQRLPKLNSRKVIRNLLNASRVNGKQSLESQESSEILGSILEQISTEEM